MNKFQIIFLFILIVFASKTLDTRAQVTIGSGLEPLQGTLLDLKENEDSLGGITSTRGIILPRVSLSDLSELSPIITGSEPNYESQKLRYKGVTVYNINATSPLQEGIYIWSGMKWNLVNTDVSRNALNGLNLETNNIKLGGILTEKTIISQNNNDFVIDNTKGGILRINGVAQNAAISGSSPAIEITGKVKMTTPGELDGNAKRLVINENGEVGIETPSTVQSLITYAQSTRTQEYPINSATTTSFNNGNLLIVTFDDSDLVINTITSFDSSVNEFVITEPGLYEVSGYVNYQPSSNGSNYAAINVIVQHQPVGSNSWDELSLSRMIFTGYAMRDITSTIVVPSAAIQMNAGDRIRMILKKPVGDNHGNYSTPNWGIKLPTGGKYSKSIKIIAI